MPHHPSTVLPLALPAKKELLAEPNVAASAYIASALRASCSSTPARYRLTVWKTRSASATESGAGVFRDLSATEFGTELSEDAEKLTPKGEGPCFSLGASSSGGSADHECTARYGVLLDQDEPGDAHERLSEALQDARIGHVVQVRAGKSHIYLPFAEPLPVSVAEKGDYTRVVALLLRKLGTLSGTEYDLHESQRLLPLSYVYAPRVEGEVVTTAVHEGAGLDLAAFIQCFEAELAARPAPAPESRPENAGPYWGITSAPVGGQSFAPTQERMRRARAYLASTPPAIQGEGGDRKTLQACIVVAHDFDLDDQDAFEALDEWNARCEPPWDPADLFKKIASARRSAKGPVGSKCAREESRPTTPTEDAASGSVAPVAPSTQYTRDELDAAAADQSALSGYPVDAVGLRERFLIQRGEFFHILRRCSDGFFRYGVAVSRGELPAELRGDLLVLPEVLPDPSGDADKNKAYFTKHVVRSNGTTRNKTTAEIIQEYATVASGGIEYTAELARSTFDPKGKVMRLAVWSVREELRWKEPEPLVVRYFDLFDADRDRILDWLAMAPTNLTEPTPALLITGPDSSGKGLLAHGVSRLWRRRGPVPARRFLADFNDDVLECPVVHIDEALPTDPTTGKRLTTTRLREITGDSTITIGRKFQSTAMLHGAPRFIITVNDLDAVVSSNEDLNAASQNAIAERFLHVRTTQAQRSFLKSIGGRAFTTQNDWPDRIAEYALYLAEHRKVDRGSRFLVNGDGAELAGVMAASGTIASNILFGIANHIRKPHPEVNSSRAIRVGGGHVLVNSEALLTVLPRLLPEDRRPPPQLRVFQKALASLTSDGAVRPRDEGTKRLRYRVLNIREFLRWAEAHDMDVDDLRKRIDATEDQRRSGPFEGGIVVPLPFANSQQAN